MLINSGCVEDGADTLSTRNQTGAPDKKKPDDAVTFKTGYIGALESISAVPKAPLGSRNDTCESKGQLIS
jgi:hypothetical protein